MARRSMLVLGVASAALMVAAVVAAQDTKRPQSAALPQPLTAPQECVCSAGIDLAAHGEAPSRLRNCQCGALQCVVHVGSGHLQCR